MADPLIWAPFAALAARAGALTLILPDVRLSFLPDGTVLHGDQGGAPSLVPGASPGKTLPGRTRADVAAQTLSRLEKLAARTYAPPTDESRRAGAGAGLSDND